MSVVCLGSKTPNEDLECIDVKKEAVRQAAAGMYVRISVSMLFVRTYVPNTKHHEYIKWS